MERIKKLWRNTEEDKKLQMEELKRKEEEDEIFESEFKAKRALLEMFDLDQLKELCMDVKGAGLQPEYTEEKGTGKQIELPLFKYDYIHFIMEELRLSQIKEYALKNRIVSPKFFGQ